MHRSTSIELYCLQCRGFDRSKESSSTVVLVMCVLNELVPFLSFILTFASSIVMFDHCCPFGGECAFV